LLRKSGSSFQPGRNFSTAASSRSRSLIICSKLNSSVG
jgi:hypothetical protein